MKNFRLGVKLIGGFVLVGLITLGVGLIGVRGISGLGENVTEIGEEKLPAVQHLEAMRAGGLERVAGHRALLNPRLTLSERAAVYEKNSQAQQLVQQAIDAYRQLPRTAEEEALWQELLEAWEQRRTAVERFMELSRAVDDLGILDPVGLRADLQRFRGDQYETAVMVLDYIHTGMGYGWNYDLDNSPFELWTAQFETDSDKLRDLVKQARATHAEYYEAISENREMRRAGDAAGAQQHYVDVISLSIEDTYDVFFALLQVADEAVTLYEEMMAQLMGPVQTRTDHAHQLLDDLISVTASDAADAVNTAENQVSRATTLSVIGMVVGTVLALFFGLLLTRSLTRPIGQTLAMIEDLAHGKLGNRLKMDRQDEIGKMAQAMDSFADNLEHEVLEAFDRLAHGDFTFEAEGLIREPLNKANSSLNELVHELLKAANQVESASSEISGASQTLSQGATESAASLEEISASMNEIVGQARQSAENSKEADTLSGTVQQSAQNGTEKMKGMTEAMTEIDKAGQDISKIIKTIEDIAFQTNLLALNAAVEAARAGHHGKGFAVVAEEVRNLAARSAKAASETTALIEGTGQKTKRGMQAAEETAAALNDIAAGITKVSTLVGEISTAINEQTEGVNQINIGISQIDQSTQQNTASAEECASASEQLASQAQELRSMLSKFILSDDPAAVRPPAMANHRNSAAGSATKETATGWAELPPPTPKKKATDKSITLDDDEFGKY